MSRSSSDECSGIPGKVAPTIDRNRCEGKEECVRVCPYQIFTMGTISKNQRAVLSIIGRLKAWAHGGKQAFVTATDACHACNRCVQACPENAITLTPIRG
jgi:4Fe-4S ferredoxin